MTLVADATSRAAEIAQRCKQAHQTADGWQACCPAHEDSTPSLSITPKTDKILLRCFAGCPFDAIVKALGMTKADFFLTNPQRRNGHKRIINVFVYVDAKGNLVHETVRFDDPKDRFRQRRPHPDHPGNYLWNLDGIEPLLYHLPDVLAAVQRRETIYLCEGEKDADALVKLGLVATTNAMGAGKWRASYSEALRGAHVVLLPDNDTPGRNHGALVARALAGIASGVKVVQLPNLPDHGDVSDWLGAGGTRPVLEVLVDATPVWTPAAPLTPAPGPEPVEPYACPELPPSAAIDAHQAAEASLFLDDYISFSRTWAPRAYDGFHEAVALFVLATTAARRVRIAMGGGMYTSLYIALAARTTLYTKTTAADIGLEFLRRAGLRYLLADDDATPQALLRAMAGSVDQQYGSLTEIAQLFEQRRLAFSAQRGWFYEEWGQHLDAMMERRGGVMASFRSLLRRLDDHKEEYVYSTIGRGREVLTKPYLTLLANITPADLQPFVKKDSTLWRDGFIARIAFVSPPEGTASDAEFPRGERTIPAALIAGLDTWHRKLGIPQCHIQPDFDVKGNTKETYMALRAPLPETTYTLSDEVWKRYYAYDRAMRELISQQKTEYLDGSYARFPAKALRIAALLASLNDVANTHMIWPAQWARAQDITERWRRDLHAMVKQVHSVSEPVETAAAKAEQRIIEVIRDHGALSVRDINRWTKLAYADIPKHCAALVAAEVLTEEETLRTTKYSLMP